MRMTKKVLAFVLVVAVFATVLPVGGSKVKAAEGMEPTSASDFYYRNEVDGIHISGYHGSATTVVIPSEIEGREVVGIDKSAFRWKNITSITIPDGVTKIGDYAFYDCSDLTSVMLPDSLMQIGTCAFGGCWRLTSIMIPDSVAQIEADAFIDCVRLNTFVVEENNPNYKSEDGVLYNKDQTELICCPVRKTEVEIPWGVVRIGDKAFYDHIVRSVTIPNSVLQIGNHAFDSCSSLTSITIPNSVIQIGDGAFYDCGFFTNLTSITIPNSVTQIGRGAFSACRTLDTLVVEEGNPSYRSEAGILYNKDQTELICCPGGKMEVEIPKGVLKIGDSAFSHCEKLASIIIPDSVTEIGDSSFSTCLWLASITIPNSVTKIGAHAFEYCFDLNSITIPNSVTEIGDYVFYDCDSLTSITIPDGVTEIGDRAFYDCSSLISITIPDSVTEIGDYAFSYCSSLPNITIPDGVTEIGDCTFYDCSGLTSITIPDGVTEIGSYAFYNCSGLTSITISDSIRYISYGAFKNCNGITKLIIADGSKTITSEMVVCEQQLKEVVIPNSMIKIESWAFFGCNSLISIALPNSVTQIGERAFSGCSSLSMFIVEEDNPSYSSEDGILYNKNQTELLCCPQGKEEIKIPEGILKIGDSAFSDCSSLTSIETPDSVTEIGDRAFSYCSSLTSITIPDSVTKIGEHVFYNCSGLTSITIPDSVTEIGDYAFYNCSSLTSITIPNGVTQIGESAFSSCSSLTSIKIPDSVTEIGDDAFSYCENLISIILPNCDMEIGAMAFWRTAYMEDEANWEGNALYIGKHLIEARTGTDSSFEIKEGTRTIASHVFAEISSGPFVWHHTGSSIESVVIPDSVTTIAYQAFYDCSNLSRVEIPSSVTKINRAFDRCQKLEEIKVDGKNANYSNEDGILYNKDCTELIRCPEGRKTPVIVSDSILKIGDCAFFECGNLKNITIPGSVTQIGEYAFRWCETLTNITIPDSVTKIGEGAFGWCGLTSITLPANEIQIGDDAFYRTDYWDAQDNWEEGALYIGNHLVEIESSVSDYAIKIGTKTIADGVLDRVDTSITIPNSVAYIGASYREQLSNIKVYYDGTPAQWNQIVIDESQGTPKEIIFAREDEEPSGTCDFTYLEKDDGLYITGYTGQDTAITVPNQIDGKKVVGIQELDSSTVKSIVISNGITSIGDYAFADYEILENVILPNTLISIGVRAFEGCYGLKSIIIPDSVTQIRQSAFIGCLNLTNITIPDSVMQIGGEAFYGTGYWDEDTNWEDGALYIGTHLIETNPEIASDYVVKEGTTTISLCDFQYITSLTIPESVRYLGCEDSSRYLVMEEVRLPKVTVYYEGTPEQWNQVVIDESQGAPKKVVFAKASISYGDANGDATIDMKDVVLLRKYMAEFDYDSNSSTVAVEIGGDVNGDGIFDMKDVVLLRKYIADFDYDTGTSSVVLGQ